ncbi:MAG: hypothetical protein D8M58_12660 [Calditrichaeota bacterium]|nr:MAG: hypothetical protein DWQ03_13445 [Calditrichota bacterium]MBL1206249.1 hypothetical protein [Calditrichota bacterium]NOG46075.1 cytochrome c3 family protein [Calditrichota bacterium]
MRTKYLIILISPLLFLFWGFTIQDQVPSKSEFSHKYHIEDEELACNDCHTNVNTSTTGTDDLMPVQDVCADCHEIDDEPAVKASMQMQRVTEYSTLFSHQLHSEKEFNCVDCHGDVSQNEVGQKALTPNMKSCMDCHQTEQAENTCYTCHTTDEQLMPANHNLTFIHNHGDLARNDIMTVSGEMNCQTCHTKQYCQDCHEGENVDRMIHPLNFEFTHALTTQGKENNCITCHEERSFCSSCHIENAVMPHNHVPGWANQIPGDGGLHRIEATIDLENCMSCHEHNAEQICAQCHNN